MDEHAILTPATHPDHHTVGRHFKAWDGHVYWCDSYDPRIGYWMIRADAPPGHREDQHSEWRRNVSERAIGRTYHEVIVFADYPERGCSALGWIDSTLLTVPV